VQIPAARYQPTIPSLVSESLRVAEEAERGHKDVISGSKKEKEEIEEDFKRKLVGLKKIQNDR
jgi:hypothetical protein